MMQQLSLMLAMQSAGSTDRAAIASNVLAVANAPGVKIMPGELRKGLIILAKGGAVDYVGASNVELVGEVKPQVHIRNLRLKENPLILYVTADI
ncbi:MAG: hypothetical protein CM1200mP30_20690 [Pseudomonadota bacterium]|nr:MAG: hypothetical protein CM1200mP30_20690 [Pseudomonadota bacterium]